MTIIYIISKVFSNGFKYLKTNKKILIDTTPNTEHKF